MKLLPNWIWREENRAVATFIGTAVAATVAAAWAVFIYFNQQDAAPTSSLRPLVSAKLNTAAEIAPIPDADSGWIGGGSNPKAFCDPRLQAIQANYPSLKITMQILPEQHRSEYTPFKHDIYRYTCSFSASQS
jgi:hypothetical protein